MKKGFIIGLAIFSGITLLTAGAVGTFYMHFKNQMSWHIHEPMTEEQQVKLSSMALLPSVGSELERYADRGMRDSEYQAETYLYDDVDDMINSLPGDFRDSIEMAFENEPELSEDIAGNEVKVYYVPQLPLASEGDLDEKYEYYFYGVFQYYYILEYPDGTYRFAVNIHNT